MCYISSYDSQRNLLHKVKIRKELNELLNSQIKTKLDIALLDQDAALAAASNNELLNKKQ